MRKYCHLLGIVMFIGMLAFAVSSCNEPMTDQMDRIISTGPEPSMEDMVSADEDMVSADEDMVSADEDMVSTPEPVAPLPAGTVVFIEPRQVTSPAAGQQLKVNINVKDADDVFAYEVQIGFDPTALRYVSLENADYLPAGAFAAPAQVSGNHVTLTVSSLSTSAAAATGTLATATFEVVSAKASTITLSNVLLSDSSVTPLTLQTVDGKINAP